MTAVYDPIKFAGYVKEGLVISIGLVKRIELGPRQMTFGFDDRASDHLDMVFSFIEREYRAGGPVILGCLTDPESPLSSIDPQDILQTVFWLAEELKIHFFFSDRTIPPRQAKQALVKDPGCSLAVVTNQRVDEKAFAQAKTLAAGFFDDLPENPDQYAFSRYLVNRLESWHSRLSSYQIQAGQSGFPGGTQIRNSLVLTGRLLENKDSHSIILAFLKYKSRIPDLSENVQVLTDFYTRKLPFWSTFTGQMADFKSNLEAIRDNEKIYSVYLKLHNILTSPTPFDQIEKARRLLPELQDFHQQIELKKMESLRQSSLKETGKMIQKLITLFDTFETDDESRNRILHQLRGLNQRIGDSRRIEEINTLFNDAKDLFVDIIETL